MFIKKNTRTYKGKTYTNYLLVESFRTPKGPRQRTVCSLGDLKPRPREDWLKLAHKVQSALASQPDLFDTDDPEVQAILEKVHRQKSNYSSNIDNEPSQLKKYSSKPCEPSILSRFGNMVSVCPEEVSTEEHREAGPLHVGLQMWRRLGIDSVLQELGLTPRQQLLTCVMTLNRLINPSSERAMAQWIRDTAAGDLLDTDFSELTESPLYTHLDRIHPLRADIEGRVFHKVTDLFNLDASIYLYDLTSSYFEGLAKANPKAARGYSRDGRSDCLQVVVGMVVNRDGFPLAHEVFDGNTNDMSTVTKMLDMLDHRIGLKPGQTVVVDRGMASKKNLDHIRSRDLHYLVAARQTERNQHLEDFENLADFKDVERAPSPTNPFQKKSNIRVKLLHLDDETRILCLSEERVAKDRAIREKQESRLLVELEKCVRSVASGRLKGPEKVHERIGRLKERFPRVARYYSMFYDPENKRFTFACDEDKKAAAKELDGSYLLRTSRTDLCAEEAWRIYNLLTMAENGFRCLKTPLELRPIYHQLAHRVESHIFLSMLAYTLLVAIEKTLRDGECNDSWATVRNTLRTHQICTVVLPTTSGATLKIRRDSTPEPVHRRIYKLLGMPQQIMQPKRFWVDPDCSD